MEAGTGSASENCTVTPARRSHGRVYCSTYAVNGSFSVASADTERSRDYAYILHGCTSVHKHLSTLLINKYAHKYSEVTNCSC
jgi:hypothetical protein